MDYHMYMQQLRLLGHYMLQILDNHALALLDAVCELLLAAVILDLVCLGSYITAMTAAVGRS